MQVTASGFDEVRKVLQDRNPVIKKVHINVIVHVVSDVDESQDNEEVRHAIYGTETELFRMFPHVSFNFDLRFVTATSKPEEK